MPAFESKTLNGNALHSTAFHGNRFVVTFVASNCKPCETTLTAAQSAYADMRDVVVVGVFSREEAAEAATALASKLEVKFPLVIDEGGAIAKQFKISDVPSTFVVNPNGRVSWVGGSTLTESTLVSAIRAAE